MHDKLVVGYDLYQLFYGKLAEPPLLSFSESGGSSKTEINRHGHVFLFLILTCNSFVIVLKFRLYYRNLKGVVTMNINMTFTQKKHMIGLHYEKV